MQELKEIASAEAQSIYFDDNYFYRVINVEQAEFFFSAFSLLMPVVQEKFVKTKLFQDQVFLPKRADQTVLVHERIKYISYPHEWCALMLKDAALFHLDLQINLLNNDLYLKDAHPWNILFEKGKFTFVDIPSVVDSKIFGNLDSNSILNDEKRQNYFSEIMYSMFMPYFFQPLCGYAYGKRAWIKNRIEFTTLNAATDTITLRNCLPSKKFTLHSLINAIRLTIKMIQFKNIISQRSKLGINVILNKLHQLIESIPVKTEHSDYKLYYLQKNELSEYTLQDAWNQKQKSIYKVLLDKQIQTVLDVACNTGWYSILAAKQGKKVVALDIDEACIEDLYIKVKQQELDILPLHGSINSLTKDKYAIETGKRVLINFAERMQCDAVLALGILHHLVLGEGVSFDEIFTLLKQFTKQKLIVEFVELHDEKIVSEPDFFSSFNKNPEKFKFYTLQYFLEISKKYFDKYTMNFSFPDTRHIIVFENESCNLR